jgi:allantoin racemase
MAIYVINPNSTEGMTEGMTAAARLAAPGLPFEGWTSRCGPPAIQGAEDGKAAEAPLLDLVAKAAQEGAEGIIIGCFDDTALAQAAQAAPAIPVIGVGQAAFHLAALRQWRFSVVTTLSVSVPILEGNIASYGLAGACAGVRASEVPVLDLEHAPEAAAAKILAEAQRAVREDGAQAVVLGCAGMVRITAALRRALPVPVIDPVEAAATCLSWLTQGNPRRA